MINGGASLLLGLPFEIRGMIWASAVGDVHYHMGIANTSLPVAETPPADGSLTQQYLFCIVDWAVAQQPRSMIGPQEPWSKVIPECSAWAVCKNLEDIGTIHDLQRYAPDLSREHALSLLQHIPRIIEQKHKLNARAKRLTNLDRTEAEGNRLSNTDGSAADGTLDRDWHLNVPKLAAASQRDKGLCDVWILPRQHPHPATAISGGNWREGRYAGRLVERRFWHQGGETGEPEKSHNIVMCSFCQASPSTADPNALSHLTHDPTQLHPSTTRYRPFWFACRQMAYEVLPKLPEYFRCATFSCFIERGLGSYLSVLPPLWCANITSMHICETAQGWSVLRHLNGKDLFRKSTRLKLLRECHIQLPRYQLMTPRSLFSQPDAALRHEQEIKVENVGELADGLAEVKVALVVHDVMGIVMSSRDWLDEQKLFMASLEGQTGASVNSQDD